MDPSTLYPSRNIHIFGAGGETIVSPVVLVGVLLAGLLICVLPRKYLVWCYLVPAILVPTTQTIMLGTLHLRMYQILTVVALARLAKDGWLTKIEKNRIDRAFIYWALGFAAIFTLRWHSGGALINQIRAVFDVIGGYFVLRCLIRDEADVCRAIRVFAVIACIIGTLMAVERHTGRNPFAVLGGVPELSEVRNGTVRSQGPFEQAIPAGAFGGTLIALFIGVCVRDPKKKGLALLGIPAALTIAFTSACSTPVLAVLGAIAVFSLWPIRRKMRWLRWSIVATLVGLQLVMKADVWWLIARVDLTGSSTGWDRAALIDNTIRHFGEWWLLGTDNNPNWGWNMWDLCNWFVAQAVEGGLLSLVLFLLVLVYAFRRLGIARKLAEGNFRKEFFIWAVG
ncbi:MAG: hypothetical protein WCA20_06930, partial [Candidatus Sulfotelmatobacter sp.]